MAKSNAGRPTIMTDEALKKLEEAFAFGASDKEACFYADISHQTLYNYQKKHPQFVERKEALKERPILLARQSVVDGLKESPELALKFLERKKRDEFSLRTETKHEGAVGVNYVEEIIAGTGLRKELIGLSKKETKVDDDRQSDGDISEPSENQA